MRRCGYCEADLVGRRADARYCDDLCRRAAWAQRTGYRSAPAPEHIPAPGNGRERLVRPRASGRSGLQVSYRKAVEVAVRLLRAQESWTDRERHIAAELAMRSVLSPAQRARLEERS